MIGTVVLCAFAHPTTSEETRTTLGGDVMALRHRRQFLCLTASGAVAPVVSRPAWAQAYPNGPITLLVPFAPGGFSDALARGFANQMQAPLGQAVAVSNDGIGANGSEGVARAAATPPTGYVVSYGHWGTHVINAAAYDAHYD